MTLTLIRSAKPEKLLKEMSDHVEPDPARGIYHIRNWTVDLPIQIIVTTELEGKEYAGFRALSKSPRVEDVQQILNDSGESAHPNATRWYRDFLDLFSKLDNEVLEEAKRRTSEMGKTLVDIFRPEIEQWANERAEEIANERAEKWKAQTHLFDLYTYVQEGGMSIEYASQKANQSRNEFLESMEKAGFRMPQPTA